MQYTQLGRSGLVVSRIGLGCMSYGSPAWRPWVLDEAAAQPFFRHAIEAGINFFDTADMYSQGVSEEIAGRALATYGRRDELVIATKVHYPMGDGPNMAGLSRKHIVQACEASLRRLGVDAIDLYQVHRLDPRVPIDETLGALDQLVQQGKVRYLGAGSCAAWRLMQALARADARGLHRFVSIQNHYNLLYREEERDMLPLCRDEGLGVVPWSPLARGRLAGATATARSASDQLTPQLYDHPGDAAVIAANLALAQTRGVTPAETALAWLLHQPGVSAPIVGATKLHHLDAALRAVDLRLHADELATLESPYQPHAVRGFA
ncbi:aldo/keto reductase [Nannocystis sp.]|uniref:aldo/keto reductase n=1 Tax=Nannocystis sp. TaxID=1962667 RepID=UPI0025CEB451|nr:aldo/keto reductase [Nannocystis sp.]MBK7827577.1 aldo/keto reductase [Nannocystis sp.]